MTHNFSGKFSTLSEGFEHLGTSSFREPRTASLAVKIQRSTNNALMAAAKATSRKKTTLAEAIIETYLKEKGFLK